VSGLSSELKAVVRPKNVMTGPEPGGNVGVRVRVIVAVGVMVGVGVRVRVRVAVRVAVSVRVGVAVGVMVAVRVEVGVRVVVLVAVALRVALRVVVAVGSRVLKGVRVTVGVRVPVPVGREGGVHVGVRVIVGLKVRVGVRVLAGVRVGLPTVAAGVGGTVAVPVGVSAGVGWLNATRIAVASATLMRPSPLASAVSHVLGAPRMTSTTAWTSASSTRWSQLASNGISAALVPPRRLAPALPAVAMHRITSKQAATQSGLPRTLLMCGRTGGGTTTCPNPTEVRSHV
jgi:hypothetical protein